MRDLAARPTSPFFERSKPLKIENPDDAHSPTPIKFTTCRTRLSFAWGLFTKPALTEIRRTGIDSPAQVVRATAHPCQFPPIRNDWFHFGCASRHTLKQPVKLFVHAQHGSSAP